MKTIVEFKKKVFKTYFKCILKKNHINTAVQIYVNSHFWVPAAA